jgi:fatty acid desaturase
MSPRFPELHTDANYIASQGQTSPKKIPKHKNNGIWMILAAFASLLIGFACSANILPFFYHPWLALPLALLSFPLLILGVIRSA